MSSELEQEHSSRDRCCPGMTPHFIVLEGIDGSGTTTQSRLLAEHLRSHGLPVLETREPSGARMGQLARELLSSPEPVGGEELALLFAADRLDHLRREVEPALRAGMFVVCDRYLLSSMAYQSIECELAWVDSINRHAPWPDLTFLLELPVEVALARVASRRAQTNEAVERFDAQEVQRRLASSYNTAVSAMEVLRGIDAESVDPHLLGQLVRIDASKPVKDVSAAIKEVLARRLGGVP
jgi:dTMP kinase